METFNIQTFCSQIIELSNNKLLWDGRTELYAKSFITQLT